MERCFDFLVRGETTKDINTLEYTGDKNASENKEIIKMCGGKEQIEHQTTRCDAEYEHHQTIKGEIFVVMFVHVCMCYDNIKRTRVA